MWTAEASRATAAQLGNPADTALTSQFIAPGRPTPVHSG
jgi:hypothetical protein